MDRRPGKAGFEVTDFEREVIVRSSDVPVLVDFWAAWCGPCRFLGPVVEKLAREAEGRWDLVKVDTEANPDLARRFDIRGIPNLKLFHQGAVIAELGGALPEHQLRQWLDKELPTPGRMELAEVVRAIEAGEEVQATAMLESVLAKEPGLDEARMLLARLVALRQPVRAIELLQQHQHLADAPAVLDLAHGLLIAPADLPDRPVKTIVLSGLDALRNNDPDAALKAWLDAVVRDKGYADELARRMCVALFLLLGRDHPVAQKWRRRFDMALY